MQTRQSLGSGVSRLIVAVLLLGLVFNHSIIAADGTKGPVVPTEQTAGMLRECLDLIHKGDLKKAEENLDTITQKFALHSYPLADAVGSELALAKNQLEEAWKYANPYGSTLPEFKSEFLEGELAAGATLNAYNEYKPAASLFDWLAGNTTGQPQVIAAEGCGRALLGQKQYDKAIESYEFALNYGNTLYNNQHQLDWILGRLPAEIADAKRLKDIYLYGEDFVLYREGERLRRQENAYSQAITYYKIVAERFPNGRFADASKLYLAICTEHTGKIEDADKQLQEFYSSNKTGLYRGEALLELGRISLEYRLDFGLASKYCVLLDEWIKNARLRKPFAPGAIKEAAKPLTLAPSHQKRRTQWGHIEPVPVTPGELINESTCNWYLDSIEASCAKIGGFLFFSDNNLKQAADQFTRLITLDPECSINHLDEENFTNDYTRLSWATKHGYIYAMPDELAMFDGNQRMAILLADFYMVTNEFDSAKNIFIRLLSDGIGHLSPSKREYPQLGYATCVYWTEGGDKAYVEYNKLLTPGILSTTKLRAMFYSANISRLSGDAKIRNDGFSILCNLINLEPNNDWVYEGRILYAETLISKNNQMDAISVLRNIPKSAGDFKLAADYLIRKITNKNTEGSNQ